MIVIGPEELAPVWISAWFIPVGERPPMRVKSSVIRVTSPEPLVSAAAMVAELVPPRLAAPPCKVHRPGCLVMTTSPPFRVAICAFPLLPPPPVTFVLPPSLRGLMWMLPPDVVSMDAGERSPITDRLPLMSRSILPDVVRMAASEPTSVPPAMSRCPFVVILMFPEPVWMRAGLLASEPPVTLRSPVTFKVMGPLVDRMFAEELMPKGCSRLRSRATVP